MNSNDLSLNAVQIMNKYFIIPTASLNDAAVPTSFLVVYSPLPTSVLVHFTGYVNCV